MLTEVIWEPWASVTFAGARATYAYDGPLPNLDLVEPNLPAGAIAADIYEDGRNLGALLIFDGRAPGRDGVRQAIEQAILARLEAEQA